MTAGDPPNGPGVGVGVGVGVAVGAPAVKRNQLKLQTEFVTGPFVSMASFITCTPAVSVTGVVSVCQFPHPPVSGAAIEPLTFVPSISKWNVPPTPAEATRVSRL